MREEERVVNGELMEMNLKRQLVDYEKILQEYDFLQNDVDINGIRLKKIAKELLKKAGQSGMDHLAKEKSKNFLWRE